MAHGNVYAADKVDAALGNYFRETFAAAYETGVEALKQLGFRSYTAHRLARRHRHGARQPLPLRGDHRPSAARVRRLYGLAGMNYAK